MDICTLNNSEFQVGITLIRRGGIAQEIPLDHVLKLSVINDSMEPFPRVEIIIKDPSSTVIPLYAADNNSAIGIKIIAQEKYGADVRTINKIHAFNINRVIPINFSGQSNTYKIEGVSEHYKAWMNPIKFSTGNAKNISVTETACNILARAKIPFTRPIKDSSYTSSFITDINSSVKEHINRLLDLASINGSGFYFPWYNQIENKLEIDSLTNIINNSTLQPYNIFSVPSEGFGSEDYYTPTSIEYTNDVTATKIDRLSKGIKEYKFDHLKGVFDTRRMLYTDITNGTSVTGFDSIIDNTSNTEEDINYVQFGQGHNWFANIRNAVRTYNGVMVKIRGAAERNIGDIIVMRSSPSLKATFSGLWMNMRTTDEYSFGTNKYDQTIIMSRIGKLTK